MQPFAQFPKARLAAVRFVLTDVDDTLTDGPRLPAAALAALERLDDAGLTVIPVTAAPAGWCDLMCRMWPVAAVIGENGGLCLRYDRAAQRTERRLWASEAECRRDRRRLAELGARIRALEPQAEEAADQRYRETTLAFRNPGSPLAEAIIRRLAEAGARSVVNSLWVLGWFAAFDKLTMARRMMRELFAIDQERQRNAFIYIGDSANDEAMFGFFPNSVGVAGVTRFADHMTSLPGWVTQGGGGAGFVEIADALIAARR